MVTVSLVRLSHEHTVEFANSGVFTGMPVGRSPHWAHERVRRDELVRSSDLDHRIKLAI